MYIYMVLYNTYIYIYIYTLKFVIQETIVTKETAQSACKCVPKSRFTRPHGTYGQTLTRPSRRVIN